MLFTSYTFLIFITIFFLVWGRFRHHRVELINVFSLVFYSAWNPLYLLLIIYSAVIDFYCSLAIHKKRHHAKRFLWISVISNLSLLAFFKYFNFFNESLCDISNLLSLECQIVDFQLLLPIGISFYTFQTMAYTIDVYRKQLVPTAEFKNYFCYVSFFPQLIAGPIERAGHLLPQIERIDAGTDHGGDWREGGSLIIRGFIKKVVISNHLAIYVDPVFANMDAYSLLTIVIATLFFTIQIYCDFSGYTDIARGLAISIGIRLMENFNYPYSALSIRDFWRRWHISLSTWLRDYLYISLGGNRNGRRGTMFNLLVTMLLGGLWHGASYTFVIWGCYHGVLLTINQNSTLLKRLQIRPLFSWLGTFGLVLFGWFLFRIEKLEDISLLLWRIRTVHWGHGVDLMPNLVTIMVFFVFVTITLTEQFWLKNRIMPLTRQSRLEKAGILVGAASFYYLFAPPMDRVFIYFQF